MILQYGDPTRLVDKPWYVLELRSEHTVENVCRRIGRAMPVIFKDGGSCQVFVPVGARDLGVFPLKTNAYIFLRADRKKELTKFKGVTGCVGLLCEGEQQRVDKAIVVEDSYVQGLIKETEQAFHFSYTTIQEDSFVRIIDGLDKGFCGHVCRIDRDYALVKIDLKTRLVYVDTPLSNLKDLSDVAPQFQVFYYCDLVKDYTEEFPQEATDALKDDLQYRTPLVDVKLMEPCPEEKKVKFGRHRTVTACVKDLIFNGEKDVTVLLEKTLQAISEGKIKQPKSAFILYATMKQILLETMFKDDSRITNYRDIAHYYNDTYKISVKQISEMDQKKFHIWTAPCSSKKV